MSKTIDKIPVQFVTDENGRKKAVLISIKDWEKLQSEIKAIFEYKSMKESLQAGFAEARNFQSGKLKKKSLSAFLDEC
ncbi:MAG: hypothetical protein H6581_31360 [Bacteroidia bacterium]|nr:hypothetical protein [Bacteroidia bacterium]